MSKKDGVSRRDFVRSGAVVAGVFAAPSIFSAQEPPSPNEPIRLGLASYTFRNFNRTQLIGFMKQLNVFSLNAKDVKDHLPTDPQEESAALADYAAAGIKLHAAGAIYFPKDEDADIRAKFEYCKRAGIDVIVAGDPAPETLPRIEKFVKEYDIRIAIHNHGPEDKHFPTPQSVLEVVRKLDKRCGLCMDIGHSARTGVDVVETIAGAGDRLFDMHVKDLRDMKVKESQCDIGDGKMPFPAIFKQLKKMGYTGCVNMEYEVPVKDPTVGMLRSLSYMRGVLSGLASA
jgi:sugar phosphate isomerase/epimerase